MQRSPLRDLKASDRLQLRAFGLNLPLSGQRTQEKANEKKSQYQKNEWEQTCLKQCYAESDIVLVVEAVSFQALFFV